MDATLNLFGAPTFKTDRGLDMQRMTNSFYIDSNHHVNTPKKQVVEKKVSPFKIWGKDQFLTCEPISKYKESSSYQFARENTNIIQCNLPNLPDEKTGTETMSVKVHGYYISLLTMLPMVRDFVNRKSNNQQTRQSIDNHLTNWFDSIPSGILNRMEVDYTQPLFIYHDCRMLVNKSLQDDAVYTGLDGTEPLSDQLKCKGSAKSIALLIKKSPKIRNEKMVARCLVTASAILISSYKQSLSNPPLYTDADSLEALAIERSCILTSLENCVDALEKIGRTFLGAAQDSAQFRAALEFVLVDKFLN